MDDRQRTEVKAGKERSKGKAESRVGDMQRGRTKTPNSYWKIFKVGIMLIKIIYKSFTHSENFQIKKKNRLRTQDFKLVG